MSRIFLNISQVTFHGLETRTNRLDFCNNLSPYVCIGNVCHLNTNLDFSPYLALVTLAEVCIVWLLSGLIFCRQRT